MPDSSSRIRTRSVGPVRRSASNELYGAGQGLRPTVCKDRLGRGLDGPTALHPLVPGKTNVFPAPPRQGKRLKMPEVARLPLCLVWCPVAHVSDQVTHGRLAVSTRQGSPKENLPAQAGPAETAVPPQGSAG